MLRLAIACIYMTVLIHVVGKNDMVLIFNPSENETMFRNEGQYPVRSKLMSDRMQYFFKDLGLPASFGFL